jgi:hypothetical protein
MSETDARREAVARLVRENAPFETDRTVDAILAWHDAETRALREALAELVDQIERDVPAHRCPGYDCATCGRPSTMRVRALLTPTPGAGKDKP